VNRVPRRAGAATPGPFLMATLSVGFVSRAADLGEGNPRVLGSPRRSLVLDRLVRGPTNAARTLVLDAALVGQRRSGSQYHRHHHSPPTAPSVVCALSRYLLLPCGTAGCTSLPSPRVITSASPAPATCAAPFPARENGLRPGASAGDPSVRTRGIGEPTLPRRVQPPGTGIPPHHHSHSSPLPGSPPARPGSPRPAAPPALPCAAWTERPIGRGRRAAVCPARRLSGPDP
jgi:hypothetical protein